jgi:hypothetical protein
MSVWSICLQRDSMQIHYPYTVYHAGDLTLSVLYSDTLNSCHYKALTLMDDTLEIKDSPAFCRETWYTYIFGVLQVSNPRVDPSVTLRWFITASQTKYLIMAPQHNATFLRIYQQAWPLSW